MMTAAGASQAGKPRRNTNQHAKEALQRASSAVIMYGGAVGCLHDVFQTKAFRPVKVELMVESAIRARARH